MAKANPTAVTSASTAHPKEDAFDWNPDTYWTWTQATTAAATKTMNIDLGEASTVDGMVIWIHNYDFDYDIGVQSGVFAYDDNDDGNYTATTNYIDLNGFSKNFGYSPGDPIYRPTYYATAGPFKKRYWQFSLFSMNYAAEISQVFLCRKRSIDTSYNFPRHEDVIYNADDGAGAGGRKFIRGGSRNPITILEREYLFGGTAWGNVGLKQAWDDSHGQAYPLILSEDGVNTLVYFDDDSLDQNEIAHQIYKPRVRFRTVPYIRDGERY